LTGLAGFDGEVFVVDNASTQFNPPKRVSAIRNKNNQGYAFAANQAAVESTGGWLLFINPDVTLTDSLVKGMIMEAQEKGYDACSPLSSSKGYLLPLPSPFEVISQYTPFGKVLISRSTKATLFGGCLLIKRSVFEEIGGWDEQFFLWFEDADLTKRLYDGGFNVGWLSTNVHHFGGSSFENLTSEIKRKIFFHSLTQYARKHWSKTTWWIAYLIAHRYGAGELLPDLTGRIDITIPNLKKNLLDEFLHKNNHFIENSENYTIVTSAVKPKELLLYKKLYPYIRWIYISQNRGFSSTVNIGFRASAGKWLGTINDDVILTKNWTTDLLSNIPSGAGSVNPVIKRQSGEIESAGINILKRGKAQTITTRQEQNITVTEATNGAAVVYSKAALLNVGLFDERFGSYLEDIDLALRLKRSNYKNYVVSKVSIIHLGQSTSSSVLRNQKSFLDFKNWIRVILKNWALYDLILYFPAILIERLRNISGIVKNLE
ncbi:MAG: glycosyltransferase family 2 protein, partial [Candidatus Roizmanbacteria bacterium]